MRLFWTVLLLIFFVVCAEAFEVPVKNCMSEESIENSRLTVVKLYLQEVRNSEGLAVFHTPMGSCSLFVETANHISIIEDQRKDDIDKAWESAGVKIALLKFEELGESTMSESY